MNSSRIIAVIPAFNSEETVGHVIDRIPRPPVSETIVVDDGSLDATHKVASSRDVVVLRHLQNLGYGAAQKTLFKEAMKRNANIVVLLHDDLQYPPELIPQMCAPIVAHYGDVVLGTRRRMIHGGMPIWRFIGNRILTSLENFALHLQLTEFHTGYRAFSAEALGSLDYDSLSNDFDFDSQIIFELVGKGFKIVEIPIPTIYGQGSSSIHPFKAVKYGIHIVLMAMKRILHDTGLV
jgi:glycosyltransferase involved in cell wall biosynthesis